MVYHAIVALLGERGTNKGFDMIVGKVKQEVFDRPWACLWEFAVVVNLLQYHS
jgi:hypothetical protein